MKTWLKKRWGACLLLFGLIALIASIAYVELAPAAVSLTAGQGRQMGTVTAVISAGTLTSAEVDLEGFVVMGLFIPTIDSANLTFTVSPTTGGTFQTVKDKDGNAFTITAGTGNFAVSSDDMVDISGYRYVKIVSSATQTAEETFTFAVKG
jgi:hypothetical protein